ncbi:hypothetical protein GGR57DRAFT_113311 [Xylariaceae sp. FL1272]|nr:hypothetical protein GGR57DRAFT_113311 [Xylariaceae sp. FL1272]
MAPIVDTSIILEVVKSLRQDGLSGIIFHSTSNKSSLDPIDRTYGVEFPNGDAWAVRLPWLGTPNLDAGSVMDLVKHEMDILRDLKVSGFRWSPRLIGGDITFQNPMKHPYLVVTWIHGRHLEWTQNYPPKQDQRDKVLRQLVDIQLEMISSTTRPNTGSSATKCLTEAIDGQIMRVLEGKLPELKLKSCFVHRYLADHAFDDAIEPAVLAVSHKNIASRKIIVDDEFGIKGIVDWKYARLWPLELAVRLPRFLSIDEDSTFSLSAAKKMPESAGLRIVPSSQLLADRRLITTYLESLDDDQGLPEHTTPQTSLAHLMRTIISNPNVDWQDLVIKSCFSKGLSRDTSRQSWFLADLHGSLTKLASIPLSEMAAEGLDQFFAASTGKNGVDRERILRKVQEEN